MNSSKNLITDGQGKFSSPVQIKYLYNSAYWITVLTQIKDESIKNAFGVLLKPGEMKCSKEVVLKDGLVLHLNFSAKLAVLTGEKK